MDSISIYKLIDFKVNFKTRHVDLDNNNPKTDVQYSKIDICSPILITALNNLCRIIINSEIKVIVTVIIIPSLKGLI